MDSRGRLLFLRSLNPAHLDEVGSEPHRTLEPIDIELEDPGFRAPQAKFDGVGSQREILAGFQLAGELSLRVAQERGKQLLVFGQDELDRARGTGHGRQSAEIHLELILAAWTGGRELRSGNLNILLGKQDPRCQRLDVIHLTAPRGPVAKSELQVRGCLR